MSKKLFLASLGCPKNLVDSEVMLGILAGHGYSVTQKEKEADLIVVNTCAFIRPAVQEAIDTILALAQNKTKGACRHLVVAGCLPQRYKEELVTLFPEADAFVGTDQIAEVGRILEELEEKAPPLVFLQRTHFIMDENTPRQASTPFYSAYLKISEGCTYHCAFCTIPRIRGRLRSRSVDSIYSEASSLAEKGVRELILIGQDVSSYGDDLAGNNTLPALLRQLLKIGGLSWIRLLYLYPTKISDELLELISSEPRICPYLDIPLQHVNNRILKVMHRKYGADDVYGLVTRIRKVIPHAALRTSFIVGFPGETEAEFEELLDFVRSAKFDHVGVFTYQDEEGTASSRLAGQIPDRVKKQRQKSLLKLQQKVSMEINKAKIGTIIPVLVEGLSDETDLLLKGRSICQAPEIDGQVLISSGDTEVGAIVPVKITEAMPYDLVGEITETAISC